MRKDRKAKLWWAIQYTDIRTKLIEGRYIEKTAELL